MMRLWLAILAAGTLAAAIMPASAGDSFVSGAMINQKITDRLAEQGLDADPRLAAARKFPACDQPIEITQKFGGWKTVSVRCPASPGWKLAVRTNLADSAAPARRSSPPPRPAAKSHVGAMIFERPLRRGETIRPQDVSLARIPSRQAAGSFPDDEAVIGRQLKQAVNAGQPVLARHLHPVYLVREGDQVTLSVANSGIFVETSAIAEENGQYGSWIKVANSRSGTIIQARIVGEKKVEAEAKITQ